PICSKLKPWSDDWACCLGADEHDLLGLAPEANAPSRDLDQVVEVGEVILDQVEHLLLRLGQPIEEIREGALRLGEEIGQPGEELGKNHSVLFEVGLRSHRKTVLRAVARPQVLVLRTRVVRGGGQGTAEIGEERV